MYNDAVELWRDLRASLGEALLATGPLLAFGLPSSTHSRSPDV